MASLKHNPWLDQVKAYIPGLSKSMGHDQVGPTIKLSANEAALGASPKAQAAYAACASELHRYPADTCPELRIAIAEAEGGLDPDRIVIGNGSDEILNLVGMAFLNQGDEVIHIDYSFEMFRIITLKNGAIPVPVAAKDLLCDVDAVLAAVTDKTRLIFLANPENPTGTCLEASEIERLHAGLRDDIVLVLDGAYAEFVVQDDYDAGRALVDRADNVLMTRTFSKLHGLAALRIGWGYASPAVVDGILRVRDPFAVCTAAAAAAHASLLDTEFLKRVKDHNTYWRTELTAALEAMGLHVAPSETNFLLIRFPDADGVRAVDAYTHLTERNILLRHLPRQGLGDYLRMTIGTEQENHAFLTELRNFMQGTGL